MFRYCCLAMFVVCLAITLIPQEALCTQSQNQKTWPQYVRDFRENHNWCLSVGGYSGDWNVQSLGPLIKKSIRSRGFGTTLEYAYHLKIIDHWGVSVGSSASMIKTLEQKDFFKEHFSWVFPGLSFKLVAMPQDRWRISMGVESSMERISKLKFENQGVLYELEAMFTQKTLLMSVEYFINPNWCLKGEQKWRQVYFNRPNNSENHLENASFSKTERAYTFGLGYHVL